MIGEIGLDRRWVEEPERYEPQRAVFSHFLRRAAALDRVINVHTSGAEAECLEAIVAHGCRRVIVHWYSGPLDVLFPGRNESLIFPNHRETKYQPMGRGLTTTYVDTD